MAEYLSTNMAKDASLQALIAAVAAQSAAQASEATLQALVDKIKLNDSGSALMVGNARAKFRDGFKDLNEWDLVGALGTGQSVTLGGAANGSRYATFSSGTTANAETIYQSKETFSPPFNFRFGASASQNIANTEFHIELVEVDDAGELLVDNTLVASPLFKDAQNGMGIVFNGTTTSSALYKVRADGISELSAAAAITKTQTGTSPNFAPTQEVTITSQMDSVEFQTRARNAITKATNIACLKDYVPRPWAKYKIRLRVKNLGTAPASNTDFRIYWINILDAARVSVDFGVIGGSNDADKSLGINFNGVSNLTVGGTVTITLPNSTPYFLTSAANTNTAFIKASAGTLFHLTGYNNGAGTAYVKLYNKATAPTLASDIPVFIIPIPAGSLMPPIDLGTLGYRFAAGIAIAITGGAADNDTTAVALGQVKLQGSYL